MNEKNLFYEEKTGTYRDKYNGVRYLKTQNGYIPLVISGLPARLEEHNGKQYLMNEWGTCEIVDGKVSEKSLNADDGSPLQFTEDGQLYSKYTGIKYEVVNGKPVALYDFEHNIPAKIVTNESGEKVLVSEKGQYTITEDGVALTSTLKENMYLIRKVDDQFFKEGGEEVEQYLNSTPEERKVILDRYRLTHGISQEQLQETRESIQAQAEFNPQDITDGVESIENLGEDVTNSSLNQSIEDISQGMQEQESLQQVVDDNQQVVDTMPELS